MVGLSALGLALRLARFEGSLYGDELSTLWVVSGRSFPEMIGEVSSDAEISPPLYFALAWLSTKLGSAPELIRLPALIAGVASIPLTYLVGRRAVGRVAGLLAATVMALSPFMIAYSADGRAYTVLIALLLVSTLAMLLAIDEGGSRRWWVVYGAAACLAVYTHYTAVFVLAAQFAWLLWAHPEARRPATVASALAALGFAPWIPGLLADADAPTTDILSALQGDGFAVKRTAVEVWAFGAPYVRPGEVPGSLALRVIVAGLAVAAAAWLVRYAKGAYRSREPAERERFRRHILVFSLAAATPVAEAALLLLGGPDLFGARNLNAASGGLALAIGTVLSTAGPVLGTVCAIAVVGGFAVGAARSLEAEHGPIDLKAAATAIERDEEPGDEVVDAVSAPDVNPVPLTSLDAHLGGAGADYRLFMPPGPPPFLPFQSEAPDPDELLADAFEAADGDRLFVVGNEMTLARADAGAAPSIAPDPGAGDDVPNARILTLPPGWRLVSRQSFAGVRPTNVFVLERE